MADNLNENIQPNPPRRRRKRSQWQIFKEAYLPYIIVLAAVILIITFVVGAVTRGKDSGDPDSTGTSTEPSINASEALKQEEESLLAQAEKLASHYDYDGAMAALSKYSAGLSTNETLSAKYAEYETAKTTLVEFSDIDAVPHITFRHLIADLSRALPDDTYGQRYNNNYVTTSEFSKILQELYDNGYILVSLYDLAPVTTTDGTSAVTQGTLLLPEGKKPIVLTQTAVNYFTYIVDGDGDGLADADSDGFACKLVLDENGNLTNQMYLADGTLTTGAFDLIPILNAFVEEHPDFSYHGAKATIAVTGYDGLLGYRTDPETADKISQEFFEQEKKDVVPVIEKLRADGFDIACYTYDYAAYGNMSAADIQADLDLWTEEVTPILGEVDILVYASGSDIGDGDGYSGNKYQALKNFGFKYYVGQDNATESWGRIRDDYARHYSREVRGSLMYYYPEYYDDLFDASRVLDESRSFE